MRPHLLGRALAAYLKSADGSLMQPSAAQAREHKGLRYVVLENCRGPLAVYRVRSVKGTPVLKRLKRWPADVVSGHAG